MSKPMFLPLIGAALLALGRPLKLAEVARLLAISELAAERLMQDFEQHLAEQPLGFAITRVAEGYQLIVQPDLVPKLAPLLTPAALPTLSPAALEVLAIVAYKQPIGRAEIELMRGSSASTLVTLQERELIKVVGRKETIGKPLLYGTTQKFLLEFGLNSLEDLPALGQTQRFSEFLRG